MKPTDLSDKRKQAQRASYKATVLNAWDAMFPKERVEVGKPQRLDTNPEVRRKAKQTL